MKIDEYAATLIGNKSFTNLTPLKMYKISDSSSGYIDTFLQSRHKVSPYNDQESGITLEMIKSKPGGGYLESDNPAIEGSMEDNFDIDIDLFNNIPEEFLVTKTDIDRLVTRIKFGWKPTPKFDSYYHYHNADSVGKFKLISYNVKSAIANIDLVTEDNRDGVTLYMGRDKNKRTILGYSTKFISTSILTTYAKVKRDRRDPIASFDKNEVPLSVIVIYYMLAHECSHFFLGHVVKESGAEYTKYGPSRREQGTSFDRIINQNLSAGLFDNKFVVDSGISADDNYIGIKYLKDDNGKIKSIKEGFNIVRFNDLADLSRNNFNPDDIAYYSCFPSNASASLMCLSITSWILSLFGESLKVEDLGYKLVHGQLVRGQLVQLKNGGLGLVTEVGDYNEVADSQDIKVVPVDTLPKDMQDSVAQALKKIASGQAHEDEEGAYTAMADDDLMRVDDGKGNLDPTKVDKAIDAIHKNPTETASSKLNKLL